MKLQIPCLIFISFLVISSCNNPPAKPELANSSSAKGSYSYDAQFLKNHTRKTVELSNNNGSKILLSADYQGRVMTSTANGDSGLSFGWLNYDLISSGEKRKGFNPVGGEERFWLGPEGGQYSIYFNQGDSFTFNNWQVPFIIDTMSYDIVQSNNKEAVFNKKATIKNYRGTVFNLDINRTVTMLDKLSIEIKLKSTIPPDIKSVGYQTKNSLQNIGSDDWTKEKGLLSIWLLGMFTPTPKTIVIIPFIPVENAKAYITDSYFGTIPSDRLQIKDSVLFFKCDGSYRSKIGLSPAIAKPFAAGFDFENNVLTIVIPEIHKDASYVNSKWELQKEPYKGDVINSYNDGPLEDGTQMGPFYEIESSSPALQLKKGESVTYSQSTLHLQGTYNSLKQLCKTLLNVDLDELKIKLN